LFLFFSLSFYISIPISSSRNFCQRSNSCTTWRSKMIWPECP
jgi:hypothetical protein